MFFFPDLQIVLTRQYIAAFRKMSTTSFDPRARGRGRGRGGGALGVQGPPPGPPQTPRTLEARVVSLEKRVAFLMNAWQRVAFERSEQRAELTETLGEIQSTNREILDELQRASAPRPAPPP